jgi:hypothetical protein
VGTQGLRNQARSRGAHVRGGGGVCALRLFEEDLLNSFTGSKLTRATGVSRLSPVIMERFCDDYPTTRISYDVWPALEPAS